MLGAVGAQPVILTHRIPLPGQGQTHRYLRNSKSGDRKPLGHGAGTLMQIRAVCATTQQITGATLAPIPVLLAGEVPPPRQNLNTVRTSRAKLGPRGPMIARLAVVEERAVRVGAALSPRTVPLLLCRHAPSYWCRRCLCWN